MPENCECNPLDHKAMPCPVESTSAALKSCIDAEIARAACINNKSETLLCREQFFCYTKQTYIFWFCKLTCYSKMESKFTYYTEKKLYYDSMSKFIKPEIWETR